jgi:hypothetical protein
MADDGIIYLDNSATTQPVVEKMLPFPTKYYGNPSSGYASVSVACRVTILIATILLPVLLTSCGKESQDGGSAAGETAQESEDDFLDKDATPDERKYLVAAKPFLIAAANRQYADAYALLSSHAKARMSLNQFTPAEQRADFERNESNPLTNVTAEQFAELMRYVEAARGIPGAPKMLHVFSTNPTF